jgi:putative transcriptional regulator
MMAKKDDIALPADPDDPEDGDVTYAGLELGHNARIIRKARQSLDLSQTEFARKFMVPVATLRGWEEARIKAPEFAVAYVRVIEQHPDMVLEAVGG